MKFFKRALGWILAVLLILGYLACIAFALASPSRTDRASLFIFSR